MRFRRRTMILFGLTIGILILGLWFVGQYLRCTADEARCRSKLAQLALAIRNYRHSKGEFPPLTLRDQKANRLHSWRVLLLPYLGEEEYFSQYRLEEAWNSPHNCEWAKKAPRHIRERYQCQGDQGSHRATIVAVEYDSNPEGNRTQRLRIDDNMVSKALLTTCHPGEIPWTEPIDVSDQQVLQFLSEKTNVGCGVSFLMSDGSVGTLMDGTFAVRGTRSDLLKRMLGFTEH